MQPKYNSKAPLIVGLVLVFLSCFALAGVSLVAFDRDDEKTTKPGSIPSPDKTFGAIEQKTEQLIVPIQTTGRGGPDALPETGIKTGTYSNPPTRISSSNYSSVSNRNRPLGVGNSSNNRGLSSQGFNNFNSSTPNYNNRFNSSGSRNGSNSLLNSPSFNTGTDYSSSSRSSFNRTSSSRNNRNN
jgi:hypothetical protein